jgi:malonyl CoA-acyl carrier protein transacylase
MTGSGNDPQFYADSCPTTSMKTVITAVTLEDSGSAESLAATVLKAAGHDAATLSARRVREIRCLAPLDAMSALLAAVEELHAERCDAAVVSAIDRACKSSPAVAILLEHVPDDAASGLAVVRAAAPVPLPILVAAGQIDIRRAKLFDLQVSNAVDCRGVMDALTDALRAAPGDLPQWNVGPLSDPASEAASLGGVVALVHALSAHVLPGTGCAADSRVQWPLAAAATLRPWIDKAPRLAAVWRRDHAGDRSIVLEEARGRLERRLPVIESRRPRRLWFFAADSRHALDEAVSELREGRMGRYRGALLAEDDSDLGPKADRLLKAIRSDQATLNAPDGVFFCDTTVPAGKTAFIFPGQGAQYLGMLGDLCLDARRVQQWLERLHESYPENEYCPPAMLVAPPDAGVRARDRRLMENSLASVSRGAMVTLIGSLAMHDLLTAAGVRADVMAGYSNGENAGLIASGSWQLADLDQLFALMHVIRVNDEDDPVQRGACLAVSHAPPGAIQEEIEGSGGRLHVALENCPEQLVLFGTPGAIAGAAARLKAKNALCVPLAFDRGHHTPVYEPIVARIAPLYAMLDFQPPRVPLYSSVIAAPFPNDPDEIRRIASSQWARTVRFGATIERMYADGVRTFIEVGPGSVLTGFVRSTLKGRPHVAVPSNIPGRPAIDQVQWLLGKLFVGGHDIDRTAVTGSAIRVADTLLRHAAPADATLREVAPATVPTANAVESAAIDAASAEDVSVSTEPAGSLDTGRRILMQHFALMNRFLAAQQRAHASLAAALRPAAAHGAARGVEWPLLGDDVETSAGRLTAVREFTPQRDGLLRHHTIGVLRTDGQGAARGIAVLPFAASLELACEAAARLRGSWPGVVAMRDVRATRWLPADPRLKLRIEAELSETRPDVREVRVRLSDAGDGDEDAVAFGAFVQVSGHVGRVAPVPAVAAALPVLVSADEFNRGLFHGAGLRALREVVAADRRSIEARAVVPLDPLVPDGSYLRTPLVLIDAASQLVALWLAQLEQPPAAFPFQVDRLVQWGAPPRPGEAITMRAAIDRTGSLARAEIDILDAAGVRRCHLGGLRTRVYAFPKPFADYVFHHTSRARLSERGAAGGRHVAALPPELVDRGRSIWIRVLAGVALSPSEKTEWDALAPLRREPWLLTRIAVKEEMLDELLARGIERMAHDVTIDARDLAAASPTRDT